VSAFELQPWQAEFLRALEHSDRARTLDLRAGRGRDLRALLRANAAAALLYEAASNGKPSRALVWAATREEAEREQAVLTKTIAELAAAVGLSADLVAVEIAEEAS
jgi:hypothetical protein